MGKEKPVWENRFGTRSILAGAALFWGLLGAMLCGPLTFLPVEQIDLSLRDFTLRALPSARPHPDLVFLTLDEASFNLSHLEEAEVAASPALQAMAEEFPWSRAAYAAMIEKLLQAGAEIIVLDIHFPLPGRDDDQLAAVVARHPGRVIFGSLLDLVEEADGSISVVYSPPHESTGWFGPGSEGFVNFWPDRDGVVRTADYTTTLSQAKGAEALPGERVFNSLSARILEKMDASALLPDSPALFRFARPGSFPTYSLWQLFVPEFWERNLQGGAVFEGKTVIFGATAARFGDVFRTPVISNMPGAELHLNALSAALQGDFFALPPWWLAGLACLFSSFLALVPFGGAVRPVFALIGFLFFFLMAAGAIWLSAYFFHFLFPAGPVLGAMLASGTTAFGWCYLEERRERTRVRKVLERYVSRQIVGEVLDHPAPFLDELGGTRKDVVVLFSDLRGFTTMTESADPSALVNQLNEYLGAMVDIIFQQGGTIDKFMGDAVMAVWGSVGSQGLEADVRSAYRAAESMPRRLAELNASWKSAGRPELRLGVGLHAGGAIFGNIGSPERMELTVIGDTVNLASRLEGACKLYGVPLVFSASVEKMLPDHTHVLPLDLLRVKGRREPVEIFTSATCCSTEAFPADFVSSFSSAVLAYRNRDFAGALAILEKLSLPSDHFPPLAIYRQRCHELLESPPSADWSPVTEAAGK